jgi:L-rhamnose mutarotase
MKSPAKFFIAGTCLCVALLTSAPRCAAFSPYENYLLSGRDTHVGLIAQVVPGKEAELAQALQKLKEPVNERKLVKTGIRDLSAFQHELQGGTWVFVYFTYAGGKDYLGAAEAFESASPATAALAELITPHPRAGTYGRKWLQMEWINYIRGKNVEGPPKEVLSMVTTVRPEKEAEYRSLHQTVWPGVVDQMARGNSRNFSIFLVELGDELFEFFYVEYVGVDSAKDDALNQADPINQRWWKNTNECQAPLPGADGIWSKMEPVVAN